MYAFGISCLYDKDGAMQALEDEELARAIAASLGDDSSAPAQSAASSAGHRPAARSEMDVRDVATNTTAPASGSQQAHRRKTGISIPKEGVQGMGVLWGCTP